jgi:hypothetical protein
LLAAAALSAAAEGPLVYVVSVSSGAGASASTKLAQEIFAALGRRGIRTLAEPTGPYAAALEEITSRGKVAGAQVSVAIRLHPVGGACVTARTPPETASPEPPSATGGGLGAFAKQTELAERYRASVALAQRLSKLGRPCKGSPGWKSDYFLNEAAGATVLLEVSGAQEAFAESAADAIAVWLGERGHRTRS